MAGGRAAKNFRLDNKRKGMKKEYKEIIKQIKKALIFRKSFCTFQNKERNNRIEIRFGLYPDKMYWFVLWIYDTTMGLLNVRFYKIK